MNLLSALHLTPPPLKEKKGGALAGAPSLKCRVCQSVFHICLIYKLNSLYVFNFI